MDPTAPPPVPAPAKRSRPKHTFMLHDPESAAPAHKFTAPGFREAAMKAASKGLTVIHLRKCGTSEIREYAGSVVEIDPPILVTRRGVDRPIKYHRKPAVRYVRTFLMGSTA